MQKGLSELKSLREIQQMLPGNLAFSTIHRWRLKGLISRNGMRIRLPMQKIAGKYYVSETDLWAWLGEVGDYDCAEPLEFPRLSRDELDRRLDEEGVYLK